MPRGSSNRCIVQHIMHPPSCDRESRAISPSLWRELTQGMCLRERKQTYHVRMLLAYQQMM